MKKINLKNILKKTFKAKKKIINKTSKNKNSKKLLKKNSKIKVKVQKKKISKINKQKKVEEDLTIKKDSLKIVKGSDQKPEIKKIKVQQTEKKEYKINDYVVYPKHGVGKVKEIKKINIGGIDVETYILNFEKDKASGMVPVNKQFHLRPLASINQLNKCISILKGKPKIKRSMWSRRAQEYEAKISSGKIYDLAEVVRDLNKGDDLMVDQSYSERQLFEKAYERILSEFQIILSLSLEDTQKKLDKALKRNLQSQNVQVTQKTQETPTEELAEPVE